MKRSILLFMAPITLTTSCIQFYPKIQKTLKIDSFWGKNELLSNSKFVNFKPNYNVLSVHDGDTVMIQDRNRNKIKVRIFAIDTPEISQNIKGYWFDTTGLEQFWARRSREATIRLLNNKLIDARFSGAKTYDRKVGELFFQNKNKKTRNLSFNLLRMGLARVAYVSPKRNSKYFVNKKYYKFIKKLEAQAIKEKLGIWSLPKNKWRKVFPKWNITK